MRRRGHARGTFPSAWAAFAAYLLLALAATWPLALGLGRDVAWDLGDSLLVMWILAWDCEQLLAILGGDFSRVATFFDANIFYPSPLTLAYSDHFVAQAIQIVPVYALTGNPILCYNLLFLSTSVLSGLGMFLLARELTGNAPAAFVAGLVFAFAPYRLPSSSHLQVLSSQWMPFAFYAIARYFATRRTLPLAGAAGALIMQSLSSGYYLLFFTPFAAMFVLWETWRRGLWRDRRLWMHAGAAGVLVAAAVAPFLLPYAALRAQITDMRSAAEVARFSADVYSYATAFSEQRIWGTVLRAFPKPEGELFPGLVPLLLASIGIFWGGRVIADAPAVAPAVSARARMWLGRLLGAAALAHAAAAIWVLIARRVVVDVGPFVIRMSNIGQLLLRSAAAFGLLLIVSPNVRAAFGRFMRDRGIFVVALGAAAWLSLGPFPQSQGRPINLASPYRVLYEHVPGFEGLRAPARFAMIEAFLLAALAGYGAAALMRGRAGKTVLAAGVLFFLAEATHVPFTINGVNPLRGEVTPEARVYRPGRAPAVYHAMARQPGGSVLVELPLGQPEHDLRAVYYSTVHWQPIVNGYSGFFPRRYGALTAALSEPWRHPALAASALRSSGATHAIVHKHAYAGTEGADTSAVLRAIGAVEVFRDDTDLLFRLPR